MSDPVQNDLASSGLRSLNRVLLRVPVQQHVQFRHFGNPTAIDLAVKLDRELHSHTLPPLMRSGSRALAGACGRLPQDFGTASTAVKSAVWAFPGQVDFGDVVTRPLASSQHRARRRISTQEDGFAARIRTADAILTVTIWMLCAPVQVFSELF